MAVPEELRREGEESLRVYLERTLAQAADKVGDQYVIRYANDARVAASEIGDMFGVSQQSVAEETWSVIIARAR